MRSSAGTRIRISHKGAGPARYNRVVACARSHRPSPTTAAAKVAIQKKSGAAMGVMNQFHWNISRKSTMCPPVQRLRACSQRSIIFGLISIQRVRDKRRAGARNCRRWLTTCCTSDSGPTKLRQHTGQSLMRAALVLAQHKRNNRT